MAEIVTELETTVVDGHGTEYFVNVAADRSPSGESWDVWLEFVPLGDADPLVTPVESTQSDRADILHWASTLGEAYLQGAFQRASLSDSGLVSRAPASSIYESDVQTAAPVFDPFDVLSELGRQALRSRLQSFSRDELLAIIDASALNPARLSLARLSTLQLVVFIVTATEVQLRGRLE